MPPPSPTQGLPTYGRIACRMVFSLGLIYALTTALGLMTLPSPEHTIGDPWFTIMEVLSILISLFMTVSLIAVHHHAEASDKPYSLAALALICLTTGITSCVHFSILTLGHTAEAQSLPDFAFWFSFRWPSVVYALDILAWDWFFGLSMLFLAPVFRKNRSLCVLLVLSGVLSLAGLLGVALENMPIRNIGILGYAVLAPVAFLWIGQTMGSQKGSGAR